MSFSYPNVTEEEKEMLFLFMVDVYKILATKYSSIYSEKELTAISICFLRSYYYMIYSVDTFISITGYDDMTKDYCKEIWSDFVKRFLQRQSKQWHKVTHARSAGGVLKAIKELE